MTLAVTTDTSSVPQYPISPNAPQSVSWSPVEILYCQLTMSDPTDPSTAYMSLQNYVIDFPPGEQDPVGAFIALRKSNLSAPVQHDGVYTNNDPDKGPCDVFVENQCYLVIEIDHTIAWQFCTTKPCITMKAQYAHGKDSDNFALTLDSSGKFASFCVAIRSAPATAGGYNREGFNIVLQLPGQGPPTIYVIDPDSTNQNNIPPAGPG